MYRQIAWAIFTQAQESGGGTSSNIAQKSVKALTEGKQNKRNLIEPVLEFALLHERRLTQNEAEEILLCLIAFDLYTIAGKQKITSPNTDLDLDAYLLIFSLRHHDRNKKHQIGACLGLLSKHYGLGFTPNDAQHLLNKLIYLISQPT